MWHISEDVNCRVHSSLHLNLKDISARTTSTSDSAPVDFSSAPEEYHNLSTRLRLMLALHRPCNLRINLEEGTTPLLGQTYSQSQTEPTSFRDFHDQHLATRLHPTLTISAWSSCPFARMAVSTPMSTSLFHQLRTCSIVLEEHTPIPRSTSNMSIT